MKGKSDLFIDSLSNWSYDILPNRGMDSDLVCRIILFRNKEISHGHSQQASGKGFTPSMTFNVYPVSMLDKVKRMSSECRKTSSCIAPNVGGDYFVLQDYVLINYSSCVDCASADYKTDLCRANIKRILSRIEKNHYSSINTLLDDLHISKVWFK
ncbi:MAG TPA: hypothetical protein VMT63_11605 [Bacteroidales bacterium]|nr:hypothetical protein [Bacteroidales bacterium]